MKVQHKCKNKNPRLLEFLTKLPPSDLRAPDPKVNWEAEACRGRMRSPPKQRVKSRQVEQHGHVMEEKCYVCWVFQRLNLRVAVRTALCIDYPSDHKEQEAHAEDDGGVLVDMRHTDWLDHYPSMSACHLLQQRTRETLMTDMGNMGTPRETTRSRSLSGDVTLLIISISCRRVRCSRAGGRSFDDWESKGQYSKYTVCTHTRCIFTSTGSR